MFNNWLAKFLLSGHLTLLVWSRVPPRHHCEKRFSQLSRCLTGQGNVTWPLQAIREAGKAGRYSSLSNATWPRRRPASRLAGLPWTNRLEWNCVEPLRHSDEQDRLHVLSPWGFHTSGKREILNTRWLWWLPDRSPKHYECARWSGDLGDCFHPLWFPDK